MTTFLACELVERSSLTPQHAAMQTGCCAQLAMASSHSLFRVDVVAMTHALGQVLDPVGSRVHSVRLFLALLPHPLICSESVDCAGELPCMGWCGALMKGMGGGGSM